MLPYIAVRNDGYIDGQEFRKVRSPQGRGRLSKLSAAKAKALTKPGMYGDGRGLYLRIAAGGSKSWILRASIDGRRRDIGLGGFRTVSLARARQHADAHRMAIAEGRDPLAEKRRASMPTFAEAAVTVHGAKLAGWRSGKHTAQWLATLERYAFPRLGHMTLDRIERRDVLGVLTPIWSAKPETARRVRQRIGSVLKWGQAHGYVMHNAAGDAIDGALPPMPRTTAHLRALHYTEVSGALDAIYATQASIASRLCFHFLILTAARSGEARNATWQEIDAGRRLWTIPAARMKMNATHRVPLSGDAMQVLEQARRLDDGSGLLFPSPIRMGRPLADMTLSKLLRTGGIAARTTVHGFRSAFRDWCAETAQPRELAEAALAHARRPVEGAYFRSDLLESRRTLMEQWAGFVSGGRRNRNEVGLNDG